MKALVLSKLVSLILYKIGFSSTLGLILLLIAEVIKWLFNNSRALGRLLGIVCKHNPIKLFNSKEYLYYYNIIMFSYIDKDMKWLIFGNIVRC